MGVLQPSGTRHLTEVIVPMFRTSLRQWDFLASVAGACLFAYRAHEQPDTLSATLAVVSQAAGVSLSVVIAAAAILGAFMDQSFLKKVRAIGRDPITYLEPFVFTACLAVAVLVMALLLGQAAPRCSYGAAVAALLVGGTGLWSVFSLVPCLAMLVQFIGLKFAASAVPDDE